MSDSTVDLSPFPLNNATAIQLVEADEVPEFVDLIYLSIVDTPNQERGQFGPVLAWADEGNPELWYMCAPHGFTNLDHVKPRLSNLVEMEALDSGDHVAPILSGMVRKNDYSWDSLVRAYSSSDSWADNIIGAIMETVNASSAMWWCAAPTVASEDMRCLYALAELDDQQRQDTYDQVENYMIAGSIFEEVAHRRSTNSTEYKVALAHNNEALEELRGAIGDKAFKAVDSKLVVTDEGESYMPGNL